MLVLTRKHNEAIVIGGTIRITATRIDGQRVRLGIEAPPDVAILREELLDAPATPLPRPLANLEGRTPRTSTPSDP